MIDEKKIEEAANKHIETEYARYNSGEVEEEMICLGGKDSFKAGAKWAINEFLKDLWHPASEEPKTYKRLIEKCYLDRVRYHDTMFLGTISWDKKVESDGIICWLYIDDLFPKEGGEQ